MRRLGIAEVRVQARDELARLASPSSVARVETGAPSGAIASAHSLIAIESASFFRR